MFGRGTKSGSGTHASGQKSTDPRLVKKIKRDPKAEGPVQPGKHRKTS